MATSAIEGRFHKDKDANTWIMIMVKNCSSYVHHGSSDNKGGGQYSGGAMGSMFCSGLLTGCLLVCLAIAVLWKFRFRTFKHTSKQKRKRRHSRSNKENRKTYSSRAPEPIPSCSPNFVRREYICNPPTSSNTEKCSCLYADENTKDACECRYSTVNFRDSVRMRSVYARPRDLIPSTCTDLTIEDYMFDTVSSGGSFVYESNATRDQLQCTCNSNHDVPTGLKIGDDSHHGRNLVATYEENESEEPFYYQLQSQNTHFVHNVSKEDDTEKVQTLPGCDDGISNKYQVLSVLEEEIKNRGQTLPTTEKELGTPFQNVSELLTQRSDFSVMSDTVWIRKPSLTNDERGNVVSSVSV